uniref:Putative secreted peptide n=1 Tax=Hyalomma excavatum TaxID=257692 RepID=A0A131XMU5_9ACAR
MSGKFAALCFLLTIIFISDNMVSSTSIACKKGEKPFCTSTKNDPPQCKCVPKNSPCPPTGSKCPSGKPVTSCPTSTPHACYCDC